MIKSKATVCQATKTFSFPYLIYLTERQCRLKVFGGHEVNLGTASFASALNRCLFNGKILFNNFLFVLILWEKSLKKKSPYWLPNDKETLSKFRAFWMTICESPGITAFPRRCLSQFSNSSQFQLVKYLCRAMFFFSKQRNNKLRSQMDENDVRLAKCIAI